MGPGNSIASALQTRGADIKSKRSKQLAAALTSIAKGRMSAEELDRQMQQFLACSPRQCNPIT